MRFVIYFKVCVSSIQECYVTNGSGWRWNAQLWFWLEKWQRSLQPNCPTLLQLESPQYFAYLVQLRSQLYHNPFGESFMPWQIISLVAATQPAVLLTSVFPHKWRKQYVWLWINTFILFYFSFFTVYTFASSSRFNVELLCAQRHEPHKIVHTLRSSGGPRWY